MLALQICFRIHKQSISHCLMSRFIYLQEVTHIQVTGSFMRRLHKLIIFRFYNLCYPGCYSIRLRAIQFYVHAFAHYNDVIMSAMASQITSLTIVYSTVYSGAGQRKHHRVTGLCAGNSPVTGEFPAQRASNAENVSI